MPGVSQPQPYHQTASCHESSSSISFSASDEEDAVDSGQGEQTQQPVTLQGICSSCPQSSVVHTYTGGPRGKENNEVSHINHGSSPLRVVVLYFAKIITLLVVENNHYYHNYVNRFDIGPTLEPDITKPEMYVFLALTIQMGQTDRLLGNNGPVTHAFLWHYDETGLTP